MARPLKRDIAALTSTTFDLCIVGGGVTGLFVAHDAASRGLSVALLERGDFAEGTTSASTRLIHGGTRYLENYEFGLVREALHERRVLMQLAPHLTNPVPFMIPIYESTPVPAYLLRTGMLFYDLLSFDKNWGAENDKHMPWHHYVSAQRARQLEPTLPPEGLKGASIYFDGQSPNPMRLCIEVAKTAAANGAKLLNYAPVEGLRIEDGRVVGVEARDRLSGERFTVKARLTINCAGIWAVEVMNLLNVPPPVQLKPSKGIHVVTRPLSASHALVSVSPTGRRVMVIPWRGKSLIGTTDVFYEGPLDRIRANVDEVKGLLAEINAFLPSAKLGLADVEHAWAGARPLIFRPGKSASDLSRKYELIDHGKTSGVPGMLSVVGGKLTTSRHTAEAVTDRALKLLGRRARCVTADLPIGGGDTGELASYVARQQTTLGEIQDPAVLEELVKAYGTGWTEVKDYVQRDPRLGSRIASDRPFILAQVHHAMDTEMATSVADIALRRTDIGSMGDRAAALGRAIADEMQRKLGWTDAEKERQLAQYQDQLAIDGLSSVPAEQRPA